MRPYHAYTQSITVPMATSDSPHWLSLLDNFGANSYYISGVSNIGPLYKSTVACLDATIGASLHDVVDVEGIPTCIISDGSGGVYVGGNLTHINGTNTPGQSIVHINSNGTLDNTFSVRFSGSMGQYYQEPKVTAMVLLSGTLYVGGFGLCTLGGTYLNGTSLCAVNATTGAKVAWDPFTSPVTYEYGTAGSLPYNNPEIEYMITDGTSIFVSGGMVVVSNAITHTGFIKIHPTTAVIDDTWVPSSALPRQIGYLGSGLIVVANTTSVNLLDATTGATGGAVISGINGGVTSMVTDPPNGKVYVMGRFGVSFTKKLATNGWQKTILDTQTSLAISPDGSKLYLGNDQYDASTGAHIAAFAGTTNLSTWDASVADATAFWGVSQNLVTVQRSHRHGLARIERDGSLTPNFNPDVNLPFIATTFANTGPTFAFNPGVTVTLPGGKAGDTYFVQITIQSTNSISGGGGWNASPAVQFTNGGITSITYTTRTFWRRLTVDEGVTTDGWSTTGLAWIYADGFSVGGLGAFDYTGGVFPTATVTGFNSFTASGGAATTSDEIYLLVGASNMHAFDPGTMTGNGSSFQTDETVEVSNFGPFSVGWMYFDTNPHRNEVPSFAGGQTTPPAAPGANLTTGVAYLIPFPRNGGGLSAESASSDGANLVGLSAGVDLLYMNPGPFGPMAAYRSLRVAGGSIAATTTAKYGGTYFFGSFTTIGGVSYVRAARLLNNGTFAIDTTWHPTTTITANVTVAKVNPSETTVIYANVVAGVHQVTALDTATGNQLWTQTFSLTGGFADVNVIAFSPDESLVYVGGPFDTVGGTAGHSGIARLDAATGALQSWNPHLWSASTFLNVNAILTIGDYVYLSGSYVLGANGLLRNGALCIKASDAAWTSTWDPVHTGDDAASIDAITADAANGWLLTASTPVATLNKRRASCLQMHSGPPDDPGGPDLTAPITPGGITQTKTFASSGDISSFTVTLDQPLRRGGSLFLFLAFSNPNVRLPAITFEAGAGAVFADLGAFGPQQNSSGTAWDHGTNPGFQTYQTAIWFAAGDNSDDGDQELDAPPQVLTIKWDIACSVACAMVEVAGLNTDVYDTPYGVMHLSNADSATVVSGAGFFGVNESREASIWGIATSGATVYSGLTSTHMTYTVGPSVASTGGSGNVAIQLLYDTTTTLAAADHIDFSVNIAPSRKYAAWHWGVDLISTGNAV